MRGFFQVFISLLAIVFSIGCSPINKSSKIKCEETAVFPQVHINTDLSDSLITRAGYLRGMASFANENDCFSGSKSTYVKGRGNTSWAFPKKSYQIKFDDTTTLLSLPAGKKFILIANYSDKSMLRNELAFLLSRMSTLNWTPESEFIELVINEAYQGVYLATQKIDIAYNAISPLKAEVLLEIDHKERLHPDDTYFETAEHLFCVKAQKGATKETKAYIEKAEQSIMTGQDYEQYFNMTQLVDWYLINEIAKNNDALFNSSVYLHFKLNEPIQMGPVWDYDISFGNINYNGNDSVQGFFIRKASYFEQLFKQADFIALVKDRYAYFYSQKSYLLSQIDKKAKLIRLAADRNFVKWPILGKYIWPNNNIGLTYEEEVDYLKFWLNARMDWLQTAFLEM